MEEKIKQFEKLRLKHLLAASVFPTAVYLYFCARNIRELSVWLILVSAAILFLLAAAAYFVVYLVIRKNIAALLFCIFCWIGCYAQPLITGLLVKIWPAEHGLLAFFSFLVLAFAALLTARTYKIRKKEMLPGFIFGVSLVLLGINAVSILFHTFSGKEESIFELKTEFVKEDRLASPNIYWIHPDGMMGFDAFEKYYGDSQDAMMRSLNDRGFDVMRSANIEAAHLTAIAIPILTSPHAYDTWISQYTPDHEKAMDMHSSNILNRMSLLRRKAELQKAFSDAGYTVNTIGINGYYYPPENGYRWVVESAMAGKVWKNGKEQEKVMYVQGMLSNIGGINTYFSLCSSKITAMIMNSHVNDDDVSEYRAVMPDEKADAVILDAYQNPDVESEIYQNVLGLYDVLNGGYNSPRLTIMHNLTTHAPYRFNADGSTHENSDDPLDYYAQHIYGGKVVLGMVDMILESDPDAVIIIQADHGLHCNTEEDFMQAFGEQADAVEIWNSTFSAVRVPEQYKNGEEKHMMDTPLNITRYLVNRFVGRNYDYILKE